MANLVQQFKTQTNNLVIKVKALPKTIRALPEEELIAYGCITLGIIFIIIAIILW